MLNFFFVSDLHGSKDRYISLFEKIIEERPHAVFMGGDILPSGLMNLVMDNSPDFIGDVLIAGFTKVKEQLKEDFPKVFIILGNDDGKADEDRFIDVSQQGLWEYVHGRKVHFRGYDIYGYSYVPPSPFLLKDWEKYDVSRYVDPGCVAPDEGSHSTDVDLKKLQFTTIKKDLDLLTEGENLSKSIFLFHSPPYKTNLDRAALDGKMIEYIPLDVHIGSIAIQRFIEDYQPLITLHGHVHESASITGYWSDKIENTHCFSAAHNGKELAIVKFNPDNASEAVRELV